MAIGDDTADRYGDVAPARAAILAELKVARFGQPADIAELVRILLSPRSSYVHGALIDCNGGLTRAI